MGAAGRALWEMFVFYDAYSLAVSKFHVEL
jgi:hypothetical protein